MRLFCWALSGDVVVSSPQLGESTAFFSSFPLNLWLRHFAGRSFGTSKKKASASFSDTAFCCYNTVKIQIVISFSVGCLHSRVLLLLTSLKFLKLKKKLCYRKWLILFSLKFHRDNRQNALALYSAKRKTGEKGCIFHRTVEMKQPQTITEPF